MNLNACLLLANPTAIVIITICARAPVGAQTKIHTSHSDTPTPLPPQSQSVCNKKHWRKPPVATHCVGVCLLQRLAKKANGGIFTTCCGFVCHAHTHTNTHSPHSQRGISIIPSVQRAQPLRKLTTYVRARAGAPPKPGQDDGRHATTASRFVVDDTGGDSGAGNSAGGGSANVIIIIITQRTLSICRIVSVREHAERPGPSARARARPAKLFQRHNNNCN